MARMNNRENRWAARLFVVSLTLGLAASGCKNRRPKAPRPDIKRPPAATQHRSPPAKAPAGQDSPDGPGPESWPKALAGPLTTRSLVNEAARIELDHRGPHVDVGSPDQHKYLSGKAALAWTRPGKTQGETFARGRKGSSVDLVDRRGGSDRLVIRARAARPGLKLGVLLLDTPHAPQPLPQRWTELMFRLAKPSGPGVHTVRLAPTGRAPDKPGVEVAWIHLRRGTEQTRSTAKVGVFRFPDPRRGLVADPPRSLSYHVQLPPATQLTFDTAADRPTRFEVWAEADGLSRARVFSARSTETWRETQVDLSRYGQRFVRLQFVTRGPAASASWGRPRLRFHREPDAMPLTRRGKPARNLIQIVADTARQDAHSTLSAKAAVKTEGLDEIARRGITFTRAYATANMTLPSMTSMLTGRVHTTVLANPDDGKISKKIPLLPARLSRRKVTTAVFSANPYITRAFGLRRGWDHFISYPVLERDGSAETLFDEAGDWAIKQFKKGRRFYMLVHTMDAHHPYGYHQQFLPRFHKGPPPPGFARSFLGDISKYQAAGKCDHSPRGREYVRALYHNELAYHDHHLQGFLAKLREHGVLKNTALIYSNDHGEEMYDHGLLGHGHTEFEELLRSPLVISYPPRIPSNLRHRGLVSLLDLAPTIMDLLGFPTLPGSHGDSLLRKLTGTHDPSIPYLVAGFDNRVVYQGRYKFYDRAEEPALFDIVADPLESEDLARKMPITAHALRIMVNEAKAVPNRRLRLRSAITAGQANNKARAKIPKKTDNLLKSLGYIK